MKSGALVLLVGLLALWTEPTSASDEQRLVHPGDCPTVPQVSVFARCKDTCQDDQDCPFTQKCCSIGCGMDCVDSALSYKCVFPSEYGACNESISHYYYDPLEDQCLQFNYSGCGGNDNNFETTEACEEACRKTISGPRPKSHQPSS
ncbi:kunitz-type serine protease inhibitor spermatin-like [Podarcis muralis]